MTMICIIEDDTAISRGLEAAFRAEHYDVRSFADGETGFQEVRKGGMDLLILDLNLPGKNGEEICRDLRSSGIRLPILMLTSKSEEIDKLIGFEIGADDYVTKPFSLRELQARVRALLRRGRQTTESVEAATFGNVSVNFLKQEALKEGKVLNLSAREFRILKYFIEREGQVITRDMLLDEVWGYETFPTTRTVDNYILTIRKKIEDNPAEPVHLVTIHTAGYKFIR